MIQDISDQELREMYLASVKYFTEGRHLQPPRTSPEEEPEPDQQPPQKQHPKPQYVIDQLKAGTMSWKHYIYSLSSEELEKLRQSEREKTRRWYQQNKERKKQYHQDYNLRKKNKQKNEELSEGPNYIAGSWRTQL